MSQARAHWDRIYRERTPGETSWYQAYPAWSLALVEATGEGRTAPILDVGCGDSRLLELLAERGYTDLTGLDVSAEAIALGQRQHARLAGKIAWQQGDVLDFAPTRRVRIWHDRAVFHFLVDAPSRDRYLAALQRGLAADGHLLLAAFAADGPRQCSGLPTCGYDAPALCALLGPGFRLLDMAHENHRTPGGAVQRFAWFRFRRQRDGGR